MERTLQWIAVGAILAFAVIKLFISLFSKDKDKGCNCTCDGCGIKDACDSSKKNIPKNK